LLTVFLALYLVYLYVDLQVETAVIVEVKTLAPIQELEGLALVFFQVVLEVLLLVNNKEEEEVQEVFLQLEVMEEQIQHHQQLDHMVQEEVEEHKILEQQDQQVVMEELL
jgi:membrane-anchored glycerophosphoryl diester phosphodiesterase (GDPDase)